MSVIVDPSSESEPLPDGVESWQMFSNCLGVDPDLFFPERGASTKEAKQVCQGCVVREDCLEHALANGEKFGIWGGLSERERRRIRRQRSLARAQQESAARQAAPQSDVALG
jgi:WhiB family transcriptional regulator, redox-sensing transcriptional regulator